MKRVSKSYFEAYELIKKVGSPKKFDFEVKSHIEIGQKNNSIDFVEACSDALPVAKNNEIVELLKAFAPELQ